MFFPGCCCCQSKLLRCPLISASRVSWPRLPALPGKQEPGCCRSREATGPPTAQGSLGDTASHISTSLSSVNTICLANKGEQDRFLCIWSQRPASLDISHSQKIQGMAKKCSDFPCSMEADWLMSSKASAASHCGNCWRAGPGWPWETGGSTAPSLWNRV